MRVVLANSACRSAGTKKDNRASVVMADESFVNPEFSPPTCGFNFVFNDGGCRPNVTAAKTVCTVGFRTMPNARSKELLTRITESYCQKLWIWRDRATKAIDGIKGESVSSG